MMYSPLIPVYRLRIKCPVCGYKDNCAVTQDRSRAYCRRVVSDRPGRDGGYTHILSNDLPQPAHTVKQRPRTVEVVANRDTRHTVYASLLRSLPLLPAHRDGLLRRGLSLSAIELFKSTPTEDEAERITAEIAREYNLAGVAGFYKDSGRWCMVKIPSGFFIPVMDRHGLIQALQIRKDYQRDKDDPRYIWLSSKGRPYGASPGTPAHVQNPERIHETGKAILTEGALKAIIASEYLSLDEGGLIALSGVGCFRDNFGLALKDAFPSLHSIAIALDRDWQDNPQVKTQLRRLVRLLKLSEFESVTVRTWDNEKGIDDFLVAESFNQIVEVA